MAILHTQNCTPLACNSFIPIGTGPRPGALKSPGLGFHIGLRSLAAVAASGAWKTGPSSPEPLNVSENLYFFHIASLNAYGIELCLSTITTLLSFSGVPVAAFVNKKTLAHTNTDTPFGSRESYTTRRLPFSFLNLSAGSP